MALCRRWRYSRDRGSTAIRRTTQSYSALSRYRSVVRAYRVGPSSQQLAPARWAMHLLLYASLPKGNLPNLCFSCSSASPCKTGRRNVSACVASSQTEDPA